MHLSRRCALLLGEVKVWGYGLCELPIPCANGVNRHGTVGPFGSWDLGIVTWHTYAAPYMQEPEHTARVHVPALNFWFGAGDIFVHTYIV